MKRIILGALALSFLFSGAMAQTVSVQEAQTVAVNFWNRHHPAEISEVKAPEATPVSYGELSHMYVVNVADRGFVIVAGDRCVQPVLGYSFDSRFPERMHPEISYWLGGYEGQIADAVASGYVPSQEVADMWNQLLTQTAPDTPVSLVVVPALLTTRWDQGAPYNKYCPYDSVSHVKTVVGCVATAMAQIMRYWKHPTCGTGSHSYVPEQRTDMPFGTLSADFEHTTYIYDYMPNSVDENFSRERERNAVALLSYHCGVSVDMMYGSSSGAYSECGYWSNACATSAFSDYFKYKPTLELRKRYNYSDSVWRSMIDTNLVHGRPMYYSGHDNSGGHAFVLDGADAQGRYHFNWGWGGYADGYFSVSNLAPGVGGAGGNSTYTFNQGQTAIFDLEPIPTQLDTVDVYDTVCYDASSYTFYEHTFTPSAGEYNLVHLDTIYRLHLEVARVKLVYLNANGASGATITQRYCYLNGFTAPECSFSRSGYRFVGWCKDPDGADEIYPVGAVIPIRRSMSLYAIWEPLQGIEQVAEASVDLWPNPTTGEVTVSVGGARPVSIAVLDIVGRTVLSETHVNAVGGKAKISLEKLPAGTYTVQVGTDSGIYNRRIIKR